MKRYAILGAAVAVMVLLFLLAHQRGTVSTQGVPEAITPTNKPSNVGSRENAEGSNWDDTLQKEAVSIGVSEAELKEFLARRDEEIRLSNEAANIPVSLYGLVVDQNTNPLPDVAVILVVVEEYRDPPPATEPRRNATRLQKQTGADGRFEVSGLKGNYVRVETLTKAGYEQDYPGHVCGAFGAQTTTFLNPAVLRLWNTNLHEPLIAAEKSFVIIPDGRRYAIDLVKGTMPEGASGDLVAWIKRPEKIDRSKRYDWSCEVAVPSGGLLETQDQRMFVAPAAGYTNSFALREEADMHGWSGGFEGKLFYVQLRNGQMYGRIRVDLYADYHGKQPALIRISYAVNPSGSRLLR